MHSINVHIVVYGKVISFSQKKVKFPQNKGTHDSGVVEQDCDGEDDPEGIGDEEDDDEEENKKSEDQKTGEHDDNSSNKDDPSGMYHSIVVSAEMLIHDMGKSIK